MPDAPRRELVAAVHDVRSLHNVGAIFRTADGAGFDRIVLSGITGAPPDPRIAKVALGAEQAVPHQKLANVDELLAHLDGAWVVVLEQHARSRGPLGVELGPDPAAPLVLVACSEVYGAPAALLERADAVLELPMRGSKESLNVSIAFGIAAYALAERVRGLDEARDLRSRSAGLPVRPGVLTYGVTSGEVPGAGPRPT